MQIRKQTKNTLTLILGTSIAFLMLTLLFINVSNPNAQNATQPPVNVEFETAEPSPVQQPSPPVEQTAPPVDNAPRPEEPPPAPANSDAETEGLPDTTFEAISPEKDVDEANIIPGVRIIQFAVVVILCVILFGAIVYLRKSCFFWLEELPA